MPSNPFAKNVKVTLANGNSLCNSSMKDNSTQKIDQSYSDTGTKWESSAEAINRVFDKYDKIYGSKQTNNNNNTINTENNLTHQMIENNQQFDEHLKNN